MTPLERYVGRILLTAIVLVVITLGCHLVTAQTTQSRDLQDSVYSAVIRHYVSGSTKLLLIRGETAPCSFPNSPPDSETAIRFLGTKPDQSLVNLCKESKGGQTLKEEFDLPYKYTLIKKESFVEIFRGGILQGWETLFKRYPEAMEIVRFSAVAFDGERNRALLYFEEGSGATAGKGKYVFLSKQVNGWEVLAEALIWIV